MKKPNGKSGQVTNLGIDPAELSVLSACAEYLRLSPNRLVFAQGDPTAHFYLLEKGHVRVFYDAWNGREIDFFHCRPGDMFGLAEAFSRRPRSASAQATESSLVWAIDAGKLPEIARRAPKFMLRLTEAMSLRLHCVAVLMESVVAVPLRVRAANFLLANAKPKLGQGAIAVSEGLSHETIAHLIGCSRQTLTTLLNEFSRDGLIHIQRKRIALLDAARLRAQARVSSLET
jgi:CRP/FNR family transcriptional regulator